MRRELYEFEGAVWQMLTDPEGQLLLLEIRSEEKHQVSFAAVDIRTGRLLWKEKTFEEPWWIGATATDGQTVVLHVYADSQNPEEKHFMAVDMASGQELWSSHTFQVMGVQGEWLLGYERQEEHRAYRQLSLRSGESRKMEKAVLESLLPAENKNLHHPFHYPEAQPYFDTIREFITQYTHTHAVRGCEYLEYRNLVLISYYIEEGGALANYLLVIDTEGQLYLQEKLDQNLRQIGLGTFFIAHDKLVLIKEKNQLISYAL